MPAFGLDTFGPRALYGPGDALGPGVPEVEMPMIRASGLAVC